MRIAMESKGVIFEGKTLDDAVKKGLDALGLSRAEVMIQVMEEGSSGFLGIGARPYKVRMMPRPRRELRDPGDRPERGGRRERGGRGDRGGRGERGDRGERGPRGERRERGARGERGGRGEREARPGRERRPGDAPQRERPGGERPDRERRGAEGRERDRRGGEMRDRERHAEGLERELRRPMTPASESAPRDDARDDARNEGRGEGRRRRRRGRRDGTAAREAAPAESRPPRAAMEETGAREYAGAPAESGNGTDIPAEELAATGRGLAEGLFKAMGFEARVSAKADGDTVEVRAEIPTDSELITGEKGEVRQAIQHLLNRMLNRGGSSRYHLQLEINDFWAQREEELQTLARRLADEAAAEGVEKLTEYLNAQERRVIHVALRDDSRVRTFGLGDGLIKKVAIAPAEAEPEQKTDE
jgi:predicted RNA-binding protein Jag